MQINHLNALDASATFCVAVSGGLDSISLAFAVRDFLASSEKIICLTVDHGLREESAAEAAEVQKYLNSEGFCSVVLRWEGEKPVAAIQEKARDARYKLMTDYCVKHNINCILTAHNLNDNIETMLQRLTRGSGISGLSGIPEVSEMHNIKIIRPILTLSRAEIQAYATENKLKWWEDPTNSTDKYQRNRIRKIVDSLKSEGLEEGRVSQSIAAIKSADDALEYYAGMALQSVCEIHHAPIHAWLNVARLAEYPYETQRRVVLKILKIVGSGEEIRQESLQRFLDNLMSMNKVVKCTIAGVEIDSDNNTLFVREQSKAAQELLSDGEIVFDKKYRLILHSEKKREFYVKYLTQNGWSSIPAEFRKNIAITKKRLLYSMPAIFELENVISVPHISYTAKGYEDVKIQINSLLR